MKGGRHWRVAEEVGGKLEECLETGQEPDDGDVSRMMEALRLKAQDAIDSGEGSECRV